ncbi:MAG: glycosyltransferase family 4 protein [Nitrospiraceae bacterium]|nr:glycosyltransferase family 4 protein [Nitrospiraceae bacterium]
MKLLYCIYDHISNPWVGGGGAVRAYEICNRLALRGHEITIVCGRFPGAEDYNEGNLAFKFRGSDLNYALSTFSFALEAAIFVKRESKRFDIIIEDFAPWNPIFSTLLTTRPVVLHVNHREGTGILRRWWFFGIPFYLIEKWYPRLFRNVTALSEETRRKFNIQGAAIVPAGITGSIILVSAPSREQNNHETFVLYIGRLHVKNKGIDVLLSSIKIIGERLVLAGRGKDEHRLKEMTKRLGLAKVEFAGFITEEEKIALLRKDCILVLPSRFEGWGIVVLEAAAFGRPVIVSDIPELRYAVDGGFGLSFKTGDAGDLAEKIQVLLDNEPLRKEMGLRALEYAGNFTWDEIAERYEKFLQDIVSQRKKPLSG